MMYDKIILIYDQMGYFAGTNQIAALLKIIKKINSNIFVISDKQYKSGMIKEFNKVFYVKFGDQDIPIKLQNDLVASNKNIYLLGNGMDKIVPVISYIGKSSDIVKIIKNNKEQGIIPYVPFNLIKINNAKSQIVTLISDGKNIYPFSVHYKNILYVSNYYSQNNINNMVYKDIKQFYKGVGSSSVKETTKVYNKSNNINNVVDFSGSVNLLIILVVIICISFLVVLLISSRSTKNKLFKGK